MNDYSHYPVMRDECIEYLNLRPDATVVDATLGLGGHSAEIAKRLSTGRLISIDRDETALTRAKAQLAPYMERVTLINGNFRDLKHILAELNIPKVDGILFDLGVSSPQLDETNRGFSYSENAPLDMRMQAGSGLSADNIVNEYSADELKRILYDYGEERYAPRIAEAIVRHRQAKRIETTLELVDIIRSAMPAAALREKQHPAKRTFQAIRIAVNDELGAISEALTGIDELLNPGGRLCVISFHSLEDRIAKTAIASMENGCTCPRDFPVCVCGFKQTMKSVTKKPLLPTQAEIETNPRSRSAKLRVAERI